MSNYPKNNARSAKNSSYGHAASRPHGKRSDGFNRGPAGRPQGKRASIPVKKFNPSLFIKKVEEQEIAPVYVPTHSFADFLLEPQIKENISAKGYVSPTPIQDKAIPAILEGRDILGTANTGTGKTAAFLIPLVHNVVLKKTARVLIIAPTRELAAQIHSELNDFKLNTGISSALCIGGVSMELQKKQLAKNPEFVIGTPGRLRDLEDNGVIQFNTFTSIVLDEVDTMLDMGFLAEIKHIISQLPRKRHALFFSATIPVDLKKIMDSFLHNPVVVDVKNRQSAQNVNQDIVKVSAHNKVDVLHDLLIKPEYTKVIVFSRTKRNTDKLSKELKARGFDIAAIHGNKTQPQRKKALSVFKNDTVKILLATDVVARGIDIDDVSHVINFDLPQTYEDYIHRIGRTGRASKIGQALTFVE